MATSVNARGHCPTCGRLWNGLAEAHCGGATGCHLHFGSDSGFNRHRKEGRCMTPEELVRPREWKGVTGKPTLVPVERHGGTYWVTEARPEAAHA